MNTTTQTVFNSELLQGVADMIKSAGLDVYISSYSRFGKPTYFHFTDGINIGYCQENYFGGVTFSTVHKPCKRCGTGFGLQDGFSGLFEPTIEDAKRAFIIAPNWAKLADVRAVKKYKSWEEYTKEPLGPESYTKY